MGIGAAWNRAFTPSERAFTRRSRKHVFFRQNAWCRSLVPVGAPAALGPCRPTQSPTEVPMRRSFYAVTAIGSLLCVTAATEGCMIKTQDNADKYRQAIPQSNEVPV